MTICIAYIVLDAVLIVPCIIVLASLRHGKLTFTSGSALLIIAAANSGFVYQDAARIAEEIWIWNLLYTTSYIIIAARLFWHYRFFIYTKRK